MSKAHWLALSTLPGVGGVTIRRLIDRFGSVEAIFVAPEEELLRVPRVTTAAVARLRALSLVALEEELIQLADEGLQVLTWDDDDYPVNLRDVNDAPPVLFVRGELLPTDAEAVAIVGSREPSPDGLKLADALATELANRGLTVVSGLAAGIDTAAHLGALRAEKGRTLGVPGSGLRNIHPRRNALLAEEIARRGALLSELSPSAAPRGANLMARDRIVSGLSRAVIVVEAGEQSGSLDTAAKARRQRRIVLAVPGSPGTDRLLAEGAALLDPARVDLDELRQRMRLHTSDRGPGGNDTGQLKLW